MLLVVALTQLLIALPALVLGDEAGTTVHLARELGSWDAALGHRLARSSPGRPGGPRACCPSPSPSPR